MKTKKVKIDKPLFTGSHDRKKVSEYRKHFSEQTLLFSRCFGSKSGYHKQNPKHKIVFNARIYLESDYEKHKDGKIKDFFAGQVEEIWYGDLDLTIDQQKLQKVCNDIGEGIVITWETGDFVEKFNPKKGEK